MALENRVSEHINRKRLNVVGIPAKDLNGNITSMLVDVVREEGNVSSEGTPLTAEALRREIQELVASQQNERYANTQCTCDYSNNVATTAFVWDVLTALGLTKINHNHYDYSGGDSSGT